MSLKSERVADVSSSNAPAYWNAQCGDRTYVGSYTLMMDWAECRDYCQYFPHAGELGHSFTFADILDTDTMECLRYNMDQQYPPGNGYAGHYWAGGYRGGDGEYRWSSGQPFDFHDFVGNPGADPYIHLTPGNNYQWNTKSDQNDRNNGCLCKSQETVEEKSEVTGQCEEGWIGPINGKCVTLPDPKIFSNLGGGELMNWGDSEVFCGLLGGHLVEWDNYGEFVALSTVVVENYLNTGSHTRRWVGASPIDCRPEEIIRFKSVRTEETEEWTSLDEKYWVPGTTFRYGKPWNHYPRFEGMTGAGKNKLTHEVGHADWINAGNAPYRQKPAN